MGTGLALEGAKVASQRGVDNQITRRVRDVCDAASLRDIEAARVGRQRGRGVGERATSRIHPAADHRAREQVSIALRILTFEEGLEIGDERGVLRGNRRVGLLNTARPRAS